MEVLLLLDVGFYIFGLKLIHEGYTIHDISHDLHVFVRKCSGTQVTKKMGHIFVVKPFRNWNKGFLEFLVEEILLVPFTLHHRYHLSLPFSTIYTGRNLTFFPTSASYVLSDVLLLRPS